ncbi:hypothetical protein D1872_330060 [compost metagenome]
MGFDRDGLTFLGDDKVGFGQFPCVESPLFDDPFAAVLIAKFGTIGGAVCKSGKRHQGILVLLEHMVGVVFPVEDF